MRPAFVRFVSSRETDRAGEKAVLVLAPFPHDVFHAVFELQLSFFEGDFFDLFGFREVMLGGEFVQAIFKFVMLGREVVKLLVGLQQQSLDVLRLLIHGPPPLVEWVRNDGSGRAAACDPGRLRHERSTLYVAFQDHPVEAPKIL
jgi:hypothetical protein